VLFFFIHEFPEGVLHGNSLLVINKKLSWFQYRQLNKKNYDTSKNVLVHETKKACQS
jgi:hypothetical protein